MNANAEKWLEALESGEFQQGRGRLRHGERCQEDRYCCLGVACEVYRRETGNGEWVYPDGGEWFPCFRVGDGYLADGTLPLPVSAWLGLRTFSGFYGGELGMDSSLTSRNDGGASFKEIADIVRSEPRGLFLAAGETP
jgi:hypothetical protein